MSDPPVCQTCGAAEGSCADHPEGAGAGHVHRDIDTSGRRDPFEHAGVLVVLAIFGGIQLYRSLMTPGIPSDKRALGIVITVIVWACAWWIYRRGPSRTGTGTAHLAD